MTSPQPDLRSIAAAFRLCGDFVAAVPYGSGHINDTYALSYNQGGTPVRYLLQRVNHTIFKDVPGLMDNIQRVCAHAQARLAAAGCPDASRRALTLIPTVDGAAFHRDDRGNYWRVYVFIEHATGHNIVQSPAQAYEAARAFGAFQKLLVDLPGERLNETIPNFHHTPRRYEAFEAALAADTHNRAVAARAEIDWILARRDRASALLDLNRRGLVPERITHNDTKLNNVLLDDATGEAICVIDLDTLMPGLALYDFGDLVRTSTSPAAEDERDLGKVTMQLPMFDALVRGYLATAGDFLTPAEIANLPTAGMILTLTLAVRFMTDFLQGDTYYKIHRPNHNLDRTRTQIALVDSIDAQREAMDDCVRKAGTRP
ncbi:MAG: phosphotransferase [Planctomycetes bacterium]|nr:phosphotransferase [Planctomycetota bacterium]